MSTSPVTLDFSKAQPVDQGVSLDFSKAQKLEDDRGFLDKEIPLDSYTHATESGLQSIGRGFRGVGQGLKKMVTHPIEAADDTVNAIADLPSQIRQVPGAIHDINQSPDPTGTYLKVGQETAGQGAAQAATAAATEGIGKGIGPVVRAAKPITAKALTLASDIVDPDITGLVSPRLAHLQKVAGRVGRAMSKPGAAEQAAPLGKIPVSTAAEKTAAAAPRIARPATGVAPEAIPPISDVLPDREFFAPEDQAAALRKPPVPSEIDDVASEPASGLNTGSLPQRFAPISLETPSPETLEPESAIPPISAAKPSAVNPADLDRQLNDALGGKPLERNVPIGKQRPLGNLPEQIKESVGPSQQPPRAPLGDLRKQIREQMDPLPEGFTSVDSSAIRGYKYNPAERELEAITNGGQHYVHGDVGPEEFSKFEAADSKGKAWNDLRKAPGVTQVATVQKGSRIATRPGVLKTTKGVIAKSKAGMDPDADLTDLLEKSVEKARKTKPSKVQK